MLELIIFGVIHEGDWDLTQPQATLLAGVISGALLIAAAYIAFHGQREQRRDERARHNEQLRAQREQFREQLQSQREQWGATQRETAALKFRDEVRATYLETLKMQEELADIARNAWSARREHELEEAMQLTDRYIALYDKDFLAISRRSLVETPEIYEAVEKLRSSHFELCHLEPVGSYDDQEAQEDALDGFGKFAVVQQLMRAHLDDLLPKG